LSHCRVFVVEDDPDTREMLCRFLELEGYEVASAPNGRQALEQLRASAEYCVILLDLMMPVMDGWQFRNEQVRSETLSKIPVIVVSAAGQGPMAQIDANAVLSKPVDLDELLARVTEYCGH
jgi:CheY-like chemotaxis protein